MTVLILTTVSSDLKVSHRLSYNGDGLVGTVLIPGNVLIVTYEYGMNDDWPILIQRFTPKINIIPKNYKLDVGAGWNDQITCFTISPDGNNFIFTFFCSNIIHIWDINTGTFIKSLIGHEMTSKNYSNNSITSIMITSDGKNIISSDTGGDIIIWDMETSHIIITIITHQKANVSGVAISHDGQKIIFRSDHHIKIWCVQTGNLLRTLLSGRGIINNFVFTPDGLNIITCSDTKAIQIWNLETGELLQTLDKESIRSNKKEILRVAVTSNGKKIISGNRDGVLKILDIASGNLLDSFNLTSNQYEIFRSIHVSGDMIIVETSNKIVILKPTTIYFIETIKKYLKSKKRKLSFM